MKEDFGPTTEWPCRKNTMPKMVTIIPIPVIGFPIFIFNYTIIANKRQRELIKWAKSF